MTSDVLKYENTKGEDLGERSLCGLVTRHSSLVTVIFTAALCTVACRLDMQVQPKYKPLEQSTFFDDGRSERPVVPGTVARGRRLAITSASWG